MAEAQMELKEQTTELLKLMLLHLVRQDQDTYQPRPECHSGGDERRARTGAAPTRADTECC